MNLPDFSEVAHVTMVLDYARDWIGIINKDYFLWAMAAISMITSVLVWLIDTIRKPPQLDI